MSVISDPTRRVRYRAATSADVPAMAACRVADAKAGPADARMARYLDGTHHPHGALAPRTAFVALRGDEIVGYIAGHSTTRRLPPPGSESAGSESVGSDPDAGKGHACEGEVQYLYVARDVRRRGVASGLLRCLAEWFDARGIRRVCVNADVESDGATAFYLAARALPLNRYWYVWDDIATVLSPRS